MVIHSDLYFFAPTVSTDHLDCHHRSILIAPADTVGLRYIHEHKKVFRSTAATMSRVNFYPQGHESWPILGVKLQSDQPCHYK